MRKATTSRITRAPSKPAVMPKPVTTPASGTGTTTPKPTTTTRPMTTARPAAKPKLISRPKPKTTPVPKPIPTPLVGPPIIVTLPTPVADNGLLNQIPPESPAPPPVVSLPVPPLIITVGGQPPAPASIVEWALDGKPKPATTDSTLPGGIHLDTAVPLPSNPEKPAIIEWASHDPAPAPQPILAPQPIDGVLTGGINLDKAGYAVVESEQAKPGYMVVESDSQPPTATHAPTESSATGLPLADAVPAESEATGLPLITTPPAPVVPVISIPPNHAIEDISSIQIGDVIIVAIKLLPKTDMEVMP
jgi:hypothetical protein